MFTRLCDGQSDGHTYRRDILLSTHNICFGWEKKKNNYKLCILSRGLNPGDWTKCINCSHGTANGVDPDQIDQVLHHWVYKICSISKNIYGWYGILFFLLLEHHRCTCQPTVPTIVLYKCWNINDDLWPALVPCVTGFKALRSRWPGLLHWNKHTKILVTHKYDIWLKHQA